MRAAWRPVPRFRELTTDTTAVFLFRSNILNHCTAEQTRESERVLTTSFWFAGLFVSRARIRNKLAQAGEFRARPPSTPEIHGLKSP